MRGVKRKQKNVTPGVGHHQTEGTSSLFNAAFQRLSGLKKRPERKISAKTEEVSPKTVRDDLDEDQCFLEAVSDVRPLGGTTRKVFSMPDPNLRPAHAAPDEELEAMAHLSDLVSGIAEMDITSTDEYLEGCRPWIQPEIDAEIETGSFSGPGLPRPSRSDKARGGGENAGLPASKSPGGPEVRAGRARPWAQLGKQHARLEGTDACLAGQRGSPQDRACLCHRKAL